jgi:ABC-type arginine transport system ATPase subunit
LENKTQIKGTQMIDVLLVAVVNFFAIKIILPRSLMGESKLILADEPTANLDSENTLKAVIKIYV